VNVAQEVSRADCTSIQHW